MEAWGLEGQSKKEKEIMDNSVAIVGQGWVEVGGCKGDKW